MIQGTLGRVGAGLFVLLVAGWPLPASWSRGAADELAPPVAETRTQIPNTQLPSIDPGGPDIQASSALVMDRGTQTLLWQKDADTERAAASLTKLMTAMVVLDHTDPAHPLTVTAADLSTDPAESSMGLRAPAIVRIDELLHGLLIASGNDAAEVLARGVGGSTTTFVTWMNDKALALGTIHTHFTNPTGLDQDGAYSSAHDLAIIADYALRYPEIRTITRLAHYTAHDQSGRAYPLTSTNELNLSGETIGVKTGNTLRAGECLIALERWENHEILSVVLASPDRFAETRSLLSWTRDHAKWQ